MNHMKISVKIVENKTYSKKMSKAHSQIKKINKLIKYIWNVPTAMLFNAEDVYNYMIEQSANEIVNKKL